MKHLKLFESFEDIDSVCKKYGLTNYKRYYHTSRYTINLDGSIDVDGDVYLSNKRLTKLPLKFHKVTGDFSCSRNKLTTLEGSPKEVGGNFYCNDNKLTTLEGGPKEVGGDFGCNDNQLTTLEGSPNYVGGDFYCGDNPIHSVYELFGNYKSFIDSMDYGYLRGTDIVKSRFREALEEIGKEIPKKIEGYNYI